MLADRVRMGVVRDSGSEGFYSIYFNPATNTTVQIYDEDSSDWTLPNQLQLSVPTIFRYKVHAAGEGVRVKVNDTFVGTNGYYVFSDGFTRGTEGDFDLSALATYMGMDIEDIVSIQFTGFLD